MLEAFLVRLGRELGGQAVPWPGAVAGGLYAGRSDVEEFWAELGRGGRGGRGGGRGAAGWAGEKEFPELADLLEAKIGSGRGRGGGGGTRAAGGGAENGLLEGFRGFWREAGGVRGRPCGGGGVGGAGAAVVAGRVRAAAAGGGAAGVTCSGRWRWRRVPSGEAVTAGELRERAAGGLESAAGEAPGEAAGEVARGVAADLRAGRVPGAAGWQELVLGALAPGLGPVVVLSADAGSAGTVYPGTGTGRSCWPGPAAGTWRRPPSRTAAVVVEGSDGTAGSGQGRGARGTSRCRCGRGRRGHRRQPGRRGPLTCCRRRSARSGMRGRRG